MADDSDDDKPLLFQFKNSKVSAHVKHRASCSKEKPSKFSECRDGDKSLELIVKPPQKPGVLHDESPSPPELQPSSSAGRVFAQNPASVKVYAKRKKHSDDEIRGAKKIKASGAPNHNSHFSVHAGRNIDPGKGVNGVNIDDSNGCREHDADVCAVDSSNSPIVDFEGRDHDNSNGGTHVVLKPQKQKLTDKIDDPRLSCKASHMHSLLSKAASRIGSVKEEEEDDDLPLSKMTLPKRSKGSAIKDVAMLLNRKECKAEGNIILVNKEEEEDNLPLSKMSRPQKNKKSAMNGKKPIADDSAVKEDGYHINLSKSDKEPADVSKNKTCPSVKKQKDWAEEQRFCLSKEEEEEDDDHLPLGQMSRLKKRKASLEAQMSDEKETGKEGKERGRDIANIVTVEKKKLSAEGGADNSARLSEDKKDNKIPCADDVSLCRPACTKSDKVADVTKKVSGKGADGRAGLVGKSRAKQLLALSKSLEDTDSEEEEREDADDDDYDDDDEEEEEEEEEDVDDYEDEDYNVSNAAKSTAVKSKSGAKTTSTMLKVRASGRPKTPVSSPKSAERVGTEDDDDDNDHASDFDDDDDVEEDKSSEEEDDEEYNVSKGTSKRKKKVAATKKDAKGKEARRVKKMKDVPGAGGGQKWTTLEHNGVIFPPFYQPHGVKMLYEGKPVDLTSEEEEVATMFAVMKETDYATKPKFLANFWNDWKKILGPNHTIQKFEDCDFSPIYEWHLAEKEKKKQLSSQEKKAIKEEKAKQEEKYMWAVVDGVKEKVGNFRVEPPALFRGRGEHPKMGKLKRRIYPEDIVINIGADSPIPECPLPGHRWKEVRHDDTVTWLAYWNDPINTKEQKYVFLSPSSNLKGQSDKEKYEKARVLKDYIKDIRRTYTENFTSSDPTSRQIAVATYLIDQLALRAGNEKDDDEADTVGCCSLKVEHVTLIPPTSLQFDFLGKDSIRYFNVVKVVKPVYEAVGEFRKDKAVGSDLFDRLDTNKLNAHLKNLMPQLTAKVFRTYNASITLDNLLVETDGHLLAEKVAAYQRANKEVAILCNHQRTVSKSHGAQMEKLEGKLAELSDLVDELEKDLERARKGKPPSKDSDGNSKKQQNPDVLEKKILQTKQKMERMKLDMTIKEDLKTVALGTSKINYLDPRITVAWCKQHEVPIEKIFNKSLLAKFAWAMDVDMSFHF
ncbi:hypothetical protein GOP47_0022230 [Adiantum capillus-veneris]|uniref:DNA topoisomerase I n=1 Tax=Adiantum capillus-veneris TaxID=13818 RepID=A0A9D4Z5Z6_ADICA|nr:hypothetical protein GOP47_0022230 [Adiantum capillus-veneris]